MLKYKMTFFKLSYLSIILAVILNVIYVYKDNYIYNDLAVKLKEENINYGNNVNINNLIKNKNGNYIVIKDVNSKKIGKQEALIKVRKEKISKIIPLSVNVVDVTKPIINIKNKKLTVNVGSSINLLDNIESVIDDGVGLGYKEKYGNNDKEFYSIDTNIDFNKVGFYNVLVFSIDRAGNRSEEVFQVHVKDVVLNNIVKNSYQFSDVNVDSSNVVLVAHSLVGDKYILGGSRPGGFDCSGLVQYVYARVGKSVGRTASSQAKDGYSVSFNNIKQGDIIVMGRNGYVTHSAIYIGNGKMIHAANPSMGVIISDVNSWVLGSIDNIVSIRRIN